MAAEATRRHQGRKPRLAILINSFRGGGAERVVSLLWPRLSQEFEVFLALLSSEGNTYRMPPDENTYVLPGGESRNWQNIVRLPLLARTYHRYLADKQIDVSLSFLNRPNFINCLVKRAGWPGKVIISERVVTSLFYKSGVRKTVGKFLIRTLYPYADAIIPISRGVEHDLRTTYAVSGHYHTIYNPIDITQLRSELDGSPAKDPGQPFTFVCVARFDPQKNHAMLVDAFSRLHDVNCRLLLVGQGPEMDAIERLVRAKGLGSRVRLLGFQRDPAQFLRQADCFVLASDFEGLGNVILEALACSVPVICTDCFSGPREILAPGSDFTRQLLEDIEVAEYGILTPVTNAALLAKAMRLMISDSTLREAYAGRALERARMFDIDTISEAYQKVILETVSA